MRNAIKYYYNLDVDNLKYRNNEYLFDKYMLKKVYRPLDLNLYNYLISRNIYVHKIIPNIQNNLITKIDNNSYILLEIEQNYRVDSNTITNFFISVNTDNKKNWAELWEKKVDYYEANINKFKDSDVIDYFPYYVGLSEIAIRLYKENTFDSTISICHDRICNNIDFYSPDNIIIDYKVRDIAEYIKYTFFNDTLDEEELMYIFNSIYMKKGDYFLLYSRLLFPTYFFDAIEKKDDISMYISKINQYERLLNKIYYILSSKIKLPKIEWLIKSDIV